jgi:hypothetical protein
MICHVFSSAPILAYGLLYNARNKTTYNNTFSKTTLHEWLALYRRNRKILTGCIEILPDTAGVPSALKAAITLPEKEYFEGQEINPDLAPLSEENCLESYLNFTRTPQEEYDNINQAEMDEGSSFTNEFHFLIRVFIPCLILHRTSPAILLRKSRTGDIPSLENLLQLDPSIIFDKRIAELTHRLRDTKPSAHRQIIESLSRPAGRKVNLQKIKVFFAAYISFLSREMGHPLTEPEIRSLFDVIAMDHGLGEIDTDLPESPESFYMAIHRDMSLFKDR